MKTVIRFFGVVLCVFAVVGHVEAKVDVDRVVTTLVLVDGIAYPKEVSTGKVMIGGQWVEPSGDRSFYGESRLPATEGERAQLLSDIAAGGAGITDFLRSNLGALMGDPNVAVGLVDAINTSLGTGQGLTAGAAQGLLDTAFTTVLGTDGATRPSYDFSKLDVTGDNFAGVDLRNTGLTARQLDTAGSIEGANLAGLNLDWLNVGDKSVAGTDFTGASLKNADLSDLDTTVGSIFADADLTGSNWEGSNLDGANLAGANLTGANFNGATSSTTPNGNFTGSYMRGSNLAGVNSSNTPGANWDDVWEPVPGQEPPDESTVDCPPLQTVGTQSWSTLSSWTILDGEVTSGQVHPDVTTVISPIYSVSSAPSGQYKYEVTISDEETASPQNQIPAACVWHKSIMYWQILYSPCGETWSVYSSGQLFTNITMGTAP